MSYKIAVWEVIGPDGSILARLYNPKGINRETAQESAKIIHPEATIRLGEMEVEHDPQTYGGR